MKIKENNKCFFMDHMICEDCDETHELCFLDGEECTSPDCPEYCCGYIPKDVIVRRLAFLLDCSEPESPPSP